MFSTWLALLPLISIVSAFYPYHDTGHSRARSLSRQDVAQISDGGMFQLDLHKVQRRDNTFPVVTSNKPSAPNALAINQDGSDYSYFSTMNFGSKAQPMYMLIDTGSANTWVFSTMCTSETCSIHNTFGQEDSTSLSITKQAWNLAYGTGEVSGVVGSDKVAFANFSVNMGFGLATNASQDFDNYPMDGILGLGRSSTDQLNTPTVMQVLAKQGGLAKNVLGIHLHRATDNTKDGEITFGGYDTSKFSGSLTYSTAVGSDSWEIPLDDALVNDKPCNFVGKTAVIDTGTTYMLLPPADAKALHALIPGSVANGEGFNIPCNSNANVQVKIGGKLYSISPKDYVGKQSGTSCSSTIIGHQAFGANQWILGDVFLKNVYAVFDFDQGKIGFALPGSGSGAATTSLSSSSSSATGSSSTVTSSRSASSAIVTTGSSSTRGSSSQGPSTQSSTTTSTAATSSTSSMNNSAPASNSAVRGTTSPLEYIGWKLSLSIAAAFSVAILM